MVKQIKKVKHQVRKHFMDRNHGSWAWEQDESISGNTKYKRWQSSHYGDKSLDYRSKREKQNADDRRLDKENG